MTDAVRIDQLERQVRRLEHLAAQLLPGKLPVAGFGTAQTPTFSSVFLGGLTNERVYAERTASLANDGTAIILAGKVPHGLLIVSDLVDGTTALIGVSLATPAVDMISDIDGGFTTVATSAGKSNVYFAGANLTIENKRGSARAYSVTFIGYA